jgi:hypothetical protein
MPIDYEKSNIGLIFLNDIAKWIDEDFPEATEEGHPAYPYLRAMHSLVDIEDSYGSDSASSVVAYFLSNADDWDTTMAKGIKRYLNKLLEAFNNQ